jgi:hypothetical protein
LPGRHYQSGGNYGGGDHPVRRRSRFGEAFIALVELLREEVNNTRWPLAPRTKMLRRILAKLNHRHRQPSRIRR